MFFLLELLFCKVEEISTMTYICSNKINIDETEARHAKPFS